MRDSKINKKFKKIVTFFLLGSFKKELILFTHSLVTEKETSFLLFLSSKLHLSLWFVFLSPSGCVCVSIRALDSF